ncbi:hypothetical protein WJX81_002796 [Elliptochloris bilobata]|uniref:DUF1279 domain-containing protein n=1 Tax=Elliptochloris bilobata TaxID=381761 RepID=A0AAW1QJY3_9CHLO
MVSVLGSPNEKLGNLCRALPQDDGLKETAVAATFLSASPWISQQCPHALNTTLPMLKPAACKADYPARSLADIRRGEKPYILGGRARNCRNCKLNNLQGNFCQFKKDGVVCPAHLQAELHDLWLGQNKTSLLTFTPCDLRRLISGRTLWLSGDSQQQDMMKALMCFLYELAPPVWQRLRTTDSDLAPELDALDPWDFDLGDDTRIIFIRQDNLNKMVAYFIPFLGRAASPGDIVVVNSGLHHNNDYAGKLGVLADWGAEARRCGLQLMWRDTSPQHFNTSGGEWPGGEPPYNCTPHREPVLDGGWRNKLATPIFQERGIPVLDTWNQTTELWEFHRDNGHGHECSHFCFPSAPQVWVHALYISLLSTELPPAAVERRVSRTFYGAPWELDDTFRWHIIAFHIPKALLILILLAIVGSTSLSITQTSNRLSGRVDMLSSQPMTVHCPPPCRSLRQSIFRGCVQSRRRLLRQGRCCRGRPGLARAELKEKLDSIEKRAEQTRDAAETTEKYGLEAGLWQVFTGKGGASKDGHGKGAQAKDLLARYGSAYLITSISFAILSFGACYALVSSGVNVAALLQRIGLNVSDTSERVGTVAIAYAAHKALSPVRFPPTVALTPVVARFLGRKDRDAKGEESS